MSEKSIEQLPHGGTPRSFQVLAEWLRDNRRSLEHQISGLAIRFEEIDKENKRRLDEIHAETRKTNGRVSDLERSTELGAALESGHSDGEREAEERGKLKEAARQQRWEKRSDRAMSLFLVFCGTMLGALGHHLGIL